MNKRIYRYALVLLTSTMLSFPPAASAAPAPDMGIAAVVGSDAISSYDVENRIRFIIVTAHFSETPDVADKIRPQVVRTLIDDKLKIMEAQKNDIKVTQKDIDEAIEAIGQQRGMPNGAVYALMDANHIPHDVLIQQIKAQLLWTKLLAKKIRPQVRVSDEEIAMAGRHFTELSKHNNIANPSAAMHVVSELKISVITLPVDKPSRLQEIKRLADKLVKEVRGGANFEEVSRQFSSATASSGGKVEAFWVKPGQLDPNIAGVLAHATPGMVTDPLRSSEGFTIIKVYDVRGTSTKEAVASEPAKDQDDEDEKAVNVVMKEILIKLKKDAPNKEADMMLKMGQEVAKHPGACEDKGIASVDNLQDFDIEVNFLKEPMDSLPPAIKAIAGNLKAGDISTPFASDEGLRLFMLCSKKEAEPKPVDKEQVSHMLLQQKMELESEKYMRTLRREVFIDIR